jgi:uridylate kinase
MLFADSNIKVNRFPAAGAVSGRSTNGSSVPVCISGTIQPYNGKDLQALLNGKRIHAAVLLITDQYLIVSDPFKGTKGDEILIDGVQWQVLQMQSWRNEIMSHYEYILIRDKEGN